jgi:hypothetical protein
MTPEEIAREWGADGVVTAEEIKSLPDTAKGTLRGERALVKLGIASKTQSQDMGFRYWQNISGLGFKSINGGGAENDIEAQNRLARFFGGESVGSQSYFGPTGTEAEASAIADYDVSEVRKKYVEGEGVTRDDAREFVTKQPGGSGDELMSTTGVTDSSSSSGGSSSSSSSSTGSGHQFGSKKLLGLAAAAALIGYEVFK